MMTLKPAAHRARLDEMIGLDDPGNYDCSDAAVESITSELEMTYDLSGEDCDEIAEVIERWFLAGDE